MSANRLVINYDKTHLFVLGKSKDYGKRSMVRVNGGLHEVKSTSCEKILSCITSEDASAIHKKVISLLLDTLIVELMDFLGYQQELTLKQGSR